MKPTALLVSVILAASPLTGPSALPWGALGKTFTLALGLPPEPRHVWDPSGGDASLWVPPEGFDGSVA